MGVLGNSRFGGEYHTGLLAVLIADTLPSDSIRRGSNNCTISALLHISDNMYHTHTIPLLKAMETHKNPISRLPKVRIRFMHGCVYARTTSQGHVRDRNVNAELPDIGQVGTMPLCICSF